MQMLKQNKCVVIPSDRAQVCVEAIIALPYYKRQKEWVHKHITTNEQSSGPAAIMKNKVNRKVDELIAKDFDGLVNSMPDIGDKEAWLDEIFKKHFVLNQCGHSNISVTTLCLPEVRFVLEGKVYLAAVPLKSIAGSNMNEQIDNLSGMRLEPFKDLIAKDGVGLVLTTGCALIVPPGYYIVEVCPKEAVSSLLRWSFLSSELGHGEVVAQTLAAGMRVWPSLNGSDWSRLKDRVV
jgi:hypothetical protein